MKLRVTWLVQKTLELPEGSDDAAAEAAIVEQEDLLTDNGFENSLENDEIVT